MARLVDGVLLSVLFKLELEFTGLSGGVTLFAFFGSAGAGLKGGRLSFGFAVTAGLFVTLLVSFGSLLLFITSGGFTFFVSGNVQLETKSGLFDSFGFKFMNEAMRFKEIPSLTFFGSSGRGFCGTPAECMLRGLLGKSGDMGTVGAALTGPKVFDPCKGDMSSFAVQVEASRMGLDITGLGAMGTSVSSFSVGAFFSMGVREKPLKLPKKFTEGLMLPGGLLSESLRRRLELISSGLDRV
uniref:SFRICE_028415 n=1 Tax=Spodoptera frugiperda TaxID=7108 RepID=A0A2H1VJ07_SPOFR